MYDVGVEVFQKCLEMSEIAAESRWMLRNFSEIVGSQIVGSQVVCLRYGRNIVDKILAC